jgi:hypothetical protein
LCTKADVDTVLTLKKNALLVLASLAIDGMDFHESSVKSKCTYISLSPNEKDLEGVKAIPAYFDQTDGRKVDCLDCG